jgi:HK97 family phage portal protein
MFDRIMAKLGYTSAAESRNAMLSVINAVSSSKAVTPGAVHNAGALTWTDVYGIINSEQLNSSQASNSLKLAAVRCAIDIYTGMMMICPRKMYAVESGTQAKTKIVLTTDHPASRLFSHYFHPELQSDDAFMLIIFDVLMDGNCYFMREFDGMGRTGRLYYIHPSRVSRGNIRKAQGGEQMSNGLKAEQGQLLYYIDTGDTTRDDKHQHMVLPKDMVVHFRGKVLNAQFHCGEGFIFNGQNSMRMYRAAEKCGIAFYEKGISTQIFLSTEHRLAPDVLARMEKLFETDPEAPLDDIFKSRILEQNLKPVTVGLPFQHLQFIESRAFSVEDIARAFNIPPALLHSYMGTDAGDVDLSDAIALFIQTGLGPFIARICSQFRTEILPLPSHMLYAFEYETIYLYRCVLDKMADSLRKLFEIGTFDRTELRAVLGLGFNPGDAAANPRYVPVNLMTVEHSLHLEKGAELANEAAEKGIEQAEKNIQQSQQTLDGMVSAEEHKAVADKAAAAQSKPPSGKMNQAPSNKHLDKRIRNLATRFFNAWREQNVNAETEVERKKHSERIADNEKKMRAAFGNVINGLREYETRVLEQKRTSRVVNNRPLADAVHALNMKRAVDEFYAPGGKFAHMLNSQLTPWCGLITTSSATNNSQFNADPSVNDGKPVDAITNLVSVWLSSQNFPMELSNAIVRPEQ